MTSVISNTITQGGVAVASVPVVARLRPGPGFRTDDSTEVAGVASTTSDAAGAWSLTLEENAGITPSGSYWEIEERVPPALGGPRVWSPVVVGADASTLLASITDFPEPGAPTHLTQEAADARYASIDVGDHPDLAAHDTLGLATQTELDAVAATKANTAHSHVDADLPATLATDVEVAAAVAAHEAELDPHPGYRLEGVSITAADVAADVATQAELDAHGLDTTSVHGIADTANLVLTDDARLSDAREPEGSAGGVLSGTYPNPGFAADMATQAELDAHAATSHGGAHPDLAAHDTLGLATQTELDTVAAAKANTSHSHLVGDLPATLALDTEVTAAVDAHEAEVDPHPGYLTPAEGNAAYEAAGAVATHAGAADPHPGYRLESAAITAADVAADVATQADLDGHINDTTAAHAATAVSFAPAGSIAATTVQAAIEEVANEASGTHPDLAAHDTLGLATQTELDTVNAKIATVGSINVKTANYTAVLTDAGKTIEFNSATDVTFTIPNQATVLFLRGQWVGFVQRGVGVLTVAHADGTTKIRSEGDAFRTAGQWAGGQVYLSEDSPEEWVVLGHMMV